MNLNAFGWCLCSTHVARFVQIGIVHEIGNVIVAPRAVCAAFHSKACLWPWRQTQLQDAQQRTHSRASITTSISSTHVGHNDRHVSMEVSTEICTFQQSSEPQRAAGVKYCPLPAARRCSRPHATKTYSSGCGDSACVVQWYDYGLFASLSNSVSYLLLSLVAIGILNALLCSTLGLDTGLLIYNFAVPIVRNLTRERTKKSNITSALPSPSRRYHPPPSNTTYTATLDPIETPVWFRRLPTVPQTPPHPIPPLTASPPQSLLPTMATALTPLGLPALEMPSPTASETSSTHSNTSAHHANHNNQHQTLSTQTNQGVANPNAPARPRRAHHAPSRPNLRVAFKSFTSTATVLVGEEGSKAKPLSQYLVHKELLAGASPFFAAALNGTFAEGLEQVVRLPEEKPETWEWFLQWLYTGTLTTQPTASEIVSASQHRARGAGPGHAAGQRQGQAPCYDLHLDGDLRNQQGSPKYFLLLDLYALSDRMLTTPLSNHVLSTIARLSEQTNSVPTPSDTWILYDGIRESAPLRKLVLDLFAYKKTDKLLETHKDEWHPRFLRELVVK